VVVAAELRGVAVARGGADQARRIAPRAAAQDAALAIAGAPRRAVERAADVELVPAILDPFPDIAEHVVEAEGVRREARNRHRRASAEGATRADAVRVAGADHVAPVIGRRGAGARGIFPFRLA